MRALCDAILLVAVRQTEGETNGVLTAHSHEARNLLRNKLATVVGTNVSRSTDLLYENLQSAASKIFRPKQVGEMATCVVVGHQHAVVEAVTRLHIERALQIGVH